MKSRNKHTAEVCELFWPDNVISRKCSASDKPNPSDEEGYPLENAVVDDYDLYLDGRLIDGSEFIKHPNKYLWKNGTLSPQ